VSTFSSKSQHWTVRAPLILPPAPHTRSRMGVRGDVMRQSPDMHLTDGACDTVPFCADFGPYNLGTTFHVVSILKSLFKHPDHRLPGLRERKGGREHTLRFSSFAGHQFCEPMRCGDTKEHVLIVMKCARARTCAAYGRTCMGARVSYMCMHITWTYVLEMTHRHRLGVIVRHLCPNRTGICL